MATRSLASFLVWNAWFLYQNPSWIFRVGFYKVSLPKSLIKVKKIELKKKKNNLEELGFKLHVGAIWLLEDFWMFIHIFKIFFHFRFFFPQIPFPLLIIAIYHTLILPTQIYIKWIQLFSSLKSTTTWWNKGVCGSWCNYKEWGNMKCFENLVVVSSFCSL